MDVQLLSPELFVPAGAVYLTTVGYGTGALLGRAINANLERLYAGLKAPALRRYGETDDREDELI